jgi:hypothetical protein
MANFKVEKTKVKAFAESARRNKQMIHQSHFSDILPLPSAFFLRIRSSFCIFCLVVFLLPKSNFQNDRPQLPTTNSTRLWYLPRPSRRCWIPVSCWLPIPPSRLSFPSWGWFVNFLPSQLWSPPSLPVSFLLLVFLLPLISLFPLSFHSSSLLLFSFLLLVSPLSFSFRSSRSSSCSSDGRSLCCQCDSTRRLFQ